MTDMEECPECGRVFTQDELQRHYIREHEQNVEPEQEED